MKKGKNTGDIIELFRDLDLNPEEKTYLNFHAERLAYTVGLVQEFCALNNVSRILDVGPHFLTTAVKRSIFPEVSVMSIGYQNDHLFPPALSAGHIHYDLNDSGTKPIPTNEKFDLIIFAETIEHLHTSPTKVLWELRKLLKGDNGGILIQTPNAVSWDHRKRMLKGENPFELIRPNALDPGHFREYTLEELVAYGREIGFKVWGADYCDYWPEKGWFGRAMSSFIPSLRKAITLVFTT